MDDSVTGISMRQSFEKDMLGRLFSELDSRKIRYAILRNYENLPVSVGARDIDILVMPEHLCAAKQVVCKIAKDMNLFFANFYADERLTQFIIYKREASGILLDLKVDFFINSQIYGVEAFSAQQMLKETTSHNGIPVVSEVFMFLDKWLFHILVGKASHQKYDVQFSEIAKRNRDELQTLLIPLLGGSLSRSLLDRVISGEASSIRPFSLVYRSGLLLKMLFNNGLRGVFQQRNFLWHRLQNFIRPKGIFLSLSGPDGCGKTTVIERVIAELKIIYGEESVLYKHFRPAALPRIANVAKAAHTLKDVDADYSNPHRAKPSGLLGSFIRLAYYYSDYFYGYFRLIKPALQRRQVVLFDRYYYDMICDPGRSRIDLPFRFLNFAKILLPLPKYAFFIHVDAQTVYQRKQELSLEKIKELNKRYSALADNGVLVSVDNENALQTTVAEIVDHILNDRDNKTRISLKLSKLQSI